MHHHYRSFLHALCVAFVGLFLMNHAQADDVGLISLRLDEGADHEYTLSTDVTPQLLKVLNPPIAPTGFTTGEPDYSRRGALVHVSYPITGTRALDENDTILLPWSRSGALVHARWVDGTSKSHLFLARVDGIPIDVTQIQDPVVTLRTQISDHLIKGIDLLRNDWRWWVPALAIGLIAAANASGRRLMVYYFAGLIASLVITDFARLAIAPDIAIALALLASVIALRAPNARLHWMVAVSTTILGISVGATLEPIARTAIVTAVVGGHLVLLLIAFGLGKWATKERAAAGLRIATGACAVAGLLMVFLHPTEPEKTTMNAQLPSGSAQNGAANAPRTLTEPVMAFISVEPYEIRCEVMTSATSVIERLGTPPANPAVISLEELESFKQSVLDDLSSRVGLTLNGAPATPNHARADFLTLGAAGAYTRTSPVPEPVNEAIVGVTFTYLIPTPVASLAMNWSALPEGSTTIPATVMAPSENKGYQITADAPGFIWSAPEESMRETEVLSTPATRPSWAPLTLALVVAAFAFTTKPAVGAVCLAVALAAFPVVRITNPLGAPMTEESAKPVTETILTNIYQAFDFRDESTIYDKLALNVSGDQLAQIYLDQRRALELENRGGARARVDNVEVTEVPNVTTSGDGVAVTARWTVSGSVNHFGHTHFRRNAYHATLHLSQVDGHWKVVKIDVHDEKRVY